MKNIKIPAAGFSLIIIASASIAYLAQPNYTKKIQDEMIKSDEAISKAHEYSCAYIGKLFSSCSAKNEKACDQLKEAEQNHKKYFFEDGRITCTSQKDIIAESNQSDPLFFGDEAGNNY